MVPGTFSYNGLQEFETGQKRKPGYTFGKLCTLPIMYSCINIQKDNLVGVYA